MNALIRLAALVVVTALANCTTAKPEMMRNQQHKLEMESFCLPNAEASRVVSVSTNAAAAASLVVRPDPGPAAPIPLKVKAAFQARQALPQARSAT